MNLSVDLCGVTLANPVMTASGTFGSGAEYAEFVDLNKLGAVVTKGVANVPWEGNPTPRVYVKCDRTAEPGHRSLYQKGHSFPEAVRHEDHCQCLRSYDG